MVVRFFCVIRVPVRRSHCAPCRLRVRPCVHGVCVPCACPGSPPCPCPCLFTVGTKKGKKNRGEPGHTGDGTHTHGTRGAGAPGHTDGSHRRCDEPHPWNLTTIQTHQHTPARQRDGRNRGRLNSRRPGSDRSPLFTGTGTVATQKRLVSLLTRKPKDGVLRATEGAYQRITE